MSFLEAEKAIEDHFNASAWDYRVCLKLSPPRHGQEVPRMFVAPKLLKKRRRSHNHDAWDCEM